MKILRVRLPDEEYDTLRMAWAGGLATVLYAHPDVREDVDRWLRRGLMEFVRDSDGGLTPRVTKSNDPVFLDRIAQSLRTQLGYYAEVSEEAVRTVEPPSLAAFAARHMRVIALELAAARADIPNTDGRSHTFKIDDDEPKES